MQSNELDSNYKHSNYPTKSDSTQEERTHVSWLLKLARNLVFKKLKNLQSGSVNIIDPLGQQVFYGQNANQNEASLSVQVTVSDIRFYQMVLLGGSIGAGEAYIKGYWQADDLTSLVRIFSANLETSDKIESGLATLLAPLSKVSHWLNRNSKDGSKRNIAAHYDLGNQMYKLFLDPKMMYSSAIYPTSSTTLNEAAEYKLKHICDRLALSHEHHLLEIGTGWGGMAIYAAQYTGCTVTTTTISKAQFEYAKEQVKLAGLQDKVNVVMLDYRELSGQYDRIVSVEMIEAVGHEYYQTFFNKCSGLLKPNGSMLIQAITIADQRYHYYLNHVDFIQKYIFPGGCLPSIEQISRHVSRSTDMVIRNLEDIGLHYAQTLADWRNNFFDNIEQVRALGYGEDFINMWDFYLCYCEGGFRERAISTVQVLMAKPQSKDI